MSNKYAVLEQNVVVNLVKASASFASGKGWIATTTAKIGDTWNGSTFTTPEPVIVVPQSVPMNRARKALILFGISSATVDEKIDLIPDETQRELARADWNFSSDVLRNSPWVSTLGGMLNLTSAQIDQLFITADGLTP